MPRSSGSLAGSAGRRLNTTPECLSRGRFHLGWPGCSGIHPRRPASPCAQPLAFLKPDCLLPLRLREHAVVVHLRQLYGEPGHRPVLLLLRLLHRGVVLLRALLLRARRLSHRNAGCVWGFPLLHLDHDFMAAPWREALPLTTEGLDHARGGRRRRKGMGVAPAARTEGYGAQWF